MNTSNIIYCIKKIIFALLTAYTIIGFLYFCFLCIQELPFIYRFLKFLDIEDYFNSDAMILPAAIFSPFLILYPVIVWLFYRKETTLFGRIMATVMPVWCLVSFWGVTRLISLYISTVLNNIISLIAAAGYIAILALVIKETLKYPEPIATADSAKPAI